jgi:Nucleoside-diphosphate-sugar pyrophosphorylase involved in lipopolysaccharide biosynthesis/translation initiation factor 2B, gamma/epsilon subunits (eIF-2Bgamma/eIF-2Bepsilon)
MKALVFAAGLGTRLKPITDTLPKALVPVGDKPLLFHVVSKLKKAGISDITINVHHFADEIVDYVREQDSFGIDVHFSDERDLLRETGGGVRHARPWLEGEPFIIHNVDILSNLDIRWFEAEAHQDALSNILVSERKTQRYFLFNEKMDLVGWTNVATGEVKTPYPDLDVEKCRKLAFAGFHYISGDIFKVFDEDEWPERFPIVDFYVQECAKHAIHGVVAPDLKMVDVGKLDSLAQAEEFLKTL